jgi:probable HAF family extracellular repeat protein
MIVSRILLRLLQLEAHMRLILTTTIASGLLAGFAFAQTPSYTVTDLGALGPTGQPFFITNNGLAAGTAVVPGGTEHAVLWYKGLKGDIAAPGLGGDNSLAFGANVMGQVIGQAETSTIDPKGEDFCGFKALGLPVKGNSCLPFLWQYAVTVPLPTLGGNNGVANQINKHGAIAGIAENNTLDPVCPAPQKLQFKPVIWEDGEVHELPTFSGDPDGVAFAINDNGQAVGASGTCTTFSPQILVNLQPQHALLWETGTMTDLGNLGGTGPGTGNVALNLNNLGQVVGSSQVPSNATHAFLWTKQTGMRDLGTLPGDVNSAAIAINDNGDAVGVSLDPSYNLRAFLWHDGVVLDLNSLLPANSPLFLLLPVFINSHGQIVGLAVTSSGEPHGFIASPAGEIATGTNAVVAPLSLTTSQQSVVLDASASTSASGNLHYFYQVVPGGKLPALLQSPGDPKATVDFVSGAGLYLVQLTVTDVTGATAKSPVIMLNYQPTAPSSTRN